MHMLFLLSHLTGGEPGLITASGYMICKLTLLCGCIAAAAAGGDVEGEIMDPADIPLCNEYAATGACSAGEDCLYVHGEVCEVR